MTAVQYLAQRDELRQMSAADIVALTAEEALSFGRSVLNRRGIAVNQSEAIVSSLKSDDYEELRVVPDVDPENTTQGAAVKSDAAQIGGGL